MVIINQDQQEGRQYLEITVEFTSSNNVTQHPVLGQVDTSDHIEEQPEQIRVSIVESDVRLGAFAALVGDQPEGAQTFTQESELFLRAAKGGLVAILIRGFPLFTNYAITSISRRKNNVQQLVYDIAFRELRIAQATTVRIPPSLTNATGGPDAQDIGQQPTKPASDGLAIGWAKSAGLIQ